MKSNYDVIFSSQGEATEKKGEYLAFFFMTGVNALMTT